MEEMVCHLTVIAIGQSITMVWGNKIYNVLRKYLFNLQYLMDIIYVVVQSLNHIRSFGTPWTIAHQASLSMEFSWQEYWNGLSFPSLGDLLTQGSNSGLLHFKQIFYHQSHQGSLSYVYMCVCVQICIHIYIYMYMILKNLYVINTIKTYQFLHFLIFF